MKVVPNAEMKNDVIDVPSVNKEYRAFQLRIFDILRFFNTARPDASHAMADSDIENWGHHMFSEELELASSEDERPTKRVAFTTPKDAATKAR